MRATTVSLPRFYPIISLIGFDLRIWVCTVFSFALQLHDGTRLASNDWGMKKKKFRVYPCSKAPDRPYLQ